VHIYLELPEGSVPDELISGAKVVTGISLAMKSKSGGKSKVIMQMPAPARGLRSRLYMVDSPLEEIHVDMTKKVSEMLALRSSMATVASVYGLDSDIPNASNKKGWEDLARKVAGSVARASQLEVQVGKVRGHVVLQGVGSAYTRRKPCQ
jgi:hypothetical protein